VMIIGAGETGELTAKHLYANGAERILVVNRTFERAAQLADKFGGTPLSLEEGLQKLPETDIIISSTGSERYVLNRLQVAEAMKRRKSKPLLMIEIAMARDRDPAIASVESVLRYDFDGLEGIVESNLAQRRREAAKIEVMIDEAMAEFEQWYKTLGVVPLIR